jgi:hypothetical protein
MCSGCGMGGGEVASAPPVKGGGRRGTKVEDLNT